MIIASDPGVRFCGMSVLSKTDTGFKVHKTLTINNTRKPKGEALNFFRLFGKRKAQISFISEGFISLFDEFKDEITAHATEDPFIHWKRPTGVIPIAEISAVLAYICSNNYEVNTTGFSAKTIKAHFAGVGDAGKDNMYTALRGRIESGNIILADGIKEEDLSEHEIDSIAIGVTYLMNEEAILNAQALKNDKW